VELDLSPLEHAAELVGLRGLKARVVPHDRRRGWWFRWEDGELLVSERVLDRCAPADASALFVDEVMRQRRLRSRRLLLLWIAAPAAALAIVLSLMRSGRHLDSNLQPDPWYLSPATLLLLAAVFGCCIVWAAGNAAAAEWADDETVKLLGDATPLVRGLNEMDFEEIHLAGKVLPARPDLHRRAERLVRKHGLCEAQPPA